MDPNHIQNLSEKETEELLDLREHFMGRHGEAREARRADGAPHRTDTTMDELMKDYLARVREIDKELQRRPGGPF